ncbi:tripartite tricarboxylate transporter substrate binding protein [Bordetella petrii]|uniref:Tripartite tricarboxylate transporter substrate binding protein n=1 Tax=Bordetella petrii TaxID=94624 RepID=A0ABT7W2J2_9BORD|nr:tripartite tricarboxylate transporter substrate binding protein [Bordetella petrii]MDM9559425.1 tripartite tricarboxylate transporter substrate binding protein [Bordetella petrii]
MAHLLKQLLSACLLFLAAQSSAALADTYPSRPIKLVVPFPPGGTSDTVARVLAKGMGERLGQSVIVYNQGGGGTIIGTEAVARSAPDGYTLLWMTTPFAINHTLFAKRPYDTFEDFIPVVDVISVPLVLIVPSNSPAKTLQDLIAMAKKAPGKVAYGSSGPGGSPHLATAMFASKAGLQLNHIPYKGSAPAVMDLVAGQTDFVIDTLFLTRPQIEAGKARALAQTGAARSPLLPDVPTMREAGLDDYEASSWLSLAAPAGTPETIVSRLNATANEVLQDDAVRRSLEDQGLVIAGGSPERARTHLRAEVERWGQAVRDSGATIN